MHPVPEQLIKVKSHFHKKIIVRLRLQSVLYHHYSENRSVCDRAGEKIREKGVKIAECVGTFTG